MIKILRYSLIALAGIMTFWSLISSGNLTILIVSIALFMLWLFISQKFAFVHNLMLPVYVFSVLSGILFGNSPVLQILILLLVLTAWDMDSLYIDSMGIIKKKEEWRLIKPLLFKEAMTGLLVFSCFGISTLITFSIGFWPLVLIVLSLIFILRKLFKYNL